MKGYNNRSLNQVAIDTRVNGGSAIGGSCSNLVAPACISYSRDVMVTSP